MKPAVFEYHRATSVADAVQVLAEAEDGDGKVLAGGQSLVPMLNMRLARPSVLVDINELSELDYVRQDGDFLAIGALTRIRRVETSAEVKKWAPLLAEAITLPTRRSAIGGQSAGVSPTPTPRQKCPRCSARSTRRWSSRAEAETGPSPLATSSTDSSPPPSGPKSC
jgi:hypothetical protein